MSPTLQLLVVSLVVAAAGGYAGMRLMPVAWRRRLAAEAARIAMRTGLTAAQARRVEAKLASGGACGSCESCKACATPSASVDALAASTASVAPVTGYRSIPIRDLR